MGKSTLAAAAMLLATICFAQEALVVESVNAGSAAAAAGLKAGDRILRLDDREITALDDLREIASAHRPGDTVSMIVDRNGETIELPLTFGERPGGGASIGVRLSIRAVDGSDFDEREAVCLSWIDDTYRLEAMARELGLDLTEPLETMRACVGHDARRMTLASVTEFCDNVFKVHCSGLDLLTEIGEALVERCEDRLGESLGLRPGQYKGWKTCAQHEIFDRYALKGESSDEAACRAALLDGCGTNIDAAVETDQVSPDQRVFLDCCSTARLDPEDRGDGAACAMIDDGFPRGPCLDRSICVNRLTTEWLHCSVLD